MKLLALDTSTENCSLALWLDGEVMSRQELAGQRHSDLLLPMLEALLGDAGLSLGALDGIAFGEGPGSFTGLRIGCGVAQGLALGADLPVLGISTLLALAAAAPGERVIACLDARIGEIYHAAYELRDGLWFTVSEPSLGLAQDAPAVAGSGWIGAGSGFAAYGEALQQRYAGQLASSDGSVYPQAQEMVRLAAPLFAQGLGQDAALAAPLYIRNKVALKMSEKKVNAQLNNQKAPLVRPMRFQDVDAVLAIEHRIYAFPWTLGNFRDSLNSGYSCWTYDFCDHPIGYGILMLAAGEAHLLNLGIAHDWQGQGLGRKFLRHLIEVARQDSADMMFLEVRPSNKKAIELYLSEGFNEIGLRRNYYPAANGREDAILMGMAL